MQCTRAADKLLFCQTFGYQRGRLKTRMSTHRVGYYSGGGGGSPVAEHCGLAQDRRSGPGHSLAAEAYDLRACVAYYANGPQVWVLRFFADGVWLPRAGGVRRRLVRHLRSAVLGAALAALPCR